MSSHTRHGQQDQFNSIPTPQPSCKTQLGQQPLEYLLLKRIRPTICHQPERRLVAPGLPSPYSRISTPKASLPINHAKGIALRMKLNMINATFMIVALSAMTLAMSILPITIPPTSAGPGCPQKTNCPTVWKNHTNP